MLTIELPAEVEERFDSLAKRLGQSKAECAELAIVNYMEDVEDALRAEDRLEYGGKTIPHEEVVWELGLDA